MKTWELGPIGRGTNGMTVKVCTGATVMVSRNGGRQPARLSAHEARMLARALDDAANVADLRQDCVPGSADAKLVEALIDARRVEQ